MLRRGSHFPELTSAQGEKLVPAEEAGAASTEDCNVVRAVAITSHLAITAQASNYGHNTWLQKGDPGYTQVQQGIAQRELPCQLLRAVDLRADLRHVRHRAERHLHQLKRLPACQEVIKYLIL